MSLEILHRDGAGRIGNLAWGEHQVTFPAILWLTDRLPPAATDWGPRRATQGDPKAVFLATKSFAQGALAEDGGQLLLKRSLSPTASMREGTPALVELGDLVSVWGDAFDLHRDPARFASALAPARTTAGYNRALYAPGLGRPDHLALLAWAGIDLFDSTPLHHAAARGQYLTEAGAFQADRLRVGQCACPVCQLEAPSSLTETELDHHNQYAARAELGHVANALAEGRLRELVEARCRSHPEQVALLRRMDAQTAYLEERTPTDRAQPLWATTKESLQRIECRRFRDRVVERYRPPTAPPVLLLLPCSHRKPYSTSRTHRAFGDTLWAAGAAGLVHEVILTSPLGLVPRELELTYPAAHYDVPVTGEWDPEEGQMIRALLSNLLTKRRYARVVSHLPKSTYEIVKDLLPADTLVTCEGSNATASEALQRLELTLRQLTNEHSRARLQQLQLERLRALSDFQFGPATTDALFEGANVVGKWPTGKVMAGETQLAMLPTTRGQLSLTVEGAKRLLSAKTHRVAIEDFRPTGGVFAIGVTGADPGIRVGDEVVVHHRGDLRGVGVARMNGPEMVQLQRGEAVHLRHHA